MAKKQKRKFVLLDASLVTPTISWDKCILCQIENKEPLISPTESGYNSLSEHLNEYTKYEALPSHLQLEQIHQTIVENSAKYHKTCRSKYNSRMIERLRKKPRLDNICLDENLPQANPENKSVEGITSFTRSSCTPVDMKSTCILCELKDHKEKLVSASTLGIGPNIFAYAQLIEDQKLLSKLYSTDLIALGAKYHKSCYTNLLNKVRSKRRTQCNVNSDPSKTAYGSVVNELVTYLQDMYVYNDTVPVFRLANVVKLVDERLEQLGFTDFLVNSTRLKDQLIAFVPGLREDRVGRDVFLTFEGDVHNAIFDACSYNSLSDGMCLSRAANILREDMFAEYPKFDGSFTEPFTSENCVPKKSIMFFRMVLEGISTGKPITREEASFEEQVKVPAAAVTIAQLVRFNSIKRKRQPDAKFRRHNIDQETPLPLYLGLMIHNHTGGEKIINKMYHLGLSVSYKRVQQVEQSVAASVCEYYNQNKDIVLPPNITQDAFTCAAIDNIDHNTSSNQSIDSFHGTSISLIQYPSDHNKKNLMKSLNQNVQNSKISLPQWYTSVPPTAKRSCDNPLPLINETYGNSNFNVFEETHEWVDQVKCNAEGDILPWAVFYSRKEENTEVNKSKCTSILLPLLKEDINSPAMVRHSINIVVTLLKNINSDQIPVITADQPVYAIAKQLQWRYPNLYGEDKMFIMLGGLHIEMAIMSMIGSWLEGSGWTENLVEASVTTSGRAEGILNASHVKRSRYAHEVSYASLNILLQQAYDSNEATLAENKTDWCNRMQQESVQFKYWLTTIQLEGLLLVFVRSIRQGNLQDFISVLENICPWMFALDRVNYARWLPIFVHSLWNLPELHPTVYSEFLKGNFVGCKTMRNFSCLSHDQIHEQNNKLVKLDSKKLSLLSNKDALLKWMTAGPEISRMNSDFEDINNLEKAPLDSGKHHEDKESFKLRFQKNVRDLVQVYQENGNPFEEKDLTTVNSSKVVMNDIAAKSVLEAHVTGQEQYSTYVNDRIVCRKISIHDVIKRNNLLLFSKKKVSLKSKEKNQVAHLRKDSNVFCRLYVASQVRQGDVEEFFSHENSTYPPSISESGELRLPSCKSDIVSCVKKTCCISSEATAPDQTPNVSAIIIDGAALIHMLTPGFGITFQQYIDSVVIPYVIRRLESVSRLDLVFDQYIKGSLKSQTRQSRGSGHRIAVKPGVKIPRNFKQFLSEDSNKEELFSMLANKIVAIDSPGKQIFCTLKDKVLSSTGQESVLSISPSLHEEADARLILHAQDAAMNGHNKIVIKTVDSDVICIALFAFPFITQAEELWIEYGIGKHLQYVPIHELHSKLPTGMSELIPFFHSFTGCDTVSSFSGVGKKIAWKTWMAFRDVDVAFKEFSNISATTVTTDSIAFSLLERFVVSMYHTACTAEHVNHARRILFTQMNRNIEHIPPTADALLQHLKRSMLQCNVWRNCLTKSPSVIDPCQWGWKTDDGTTFTPLWTTIPDVSVHCQELVSCKCKERCTKCRCVKMGLRCTLLCTCEGHCSRMDT